MINVVLFVVACVALGLSIWALATPCKKDEFINNRNCKYCEHCPIKGHMVSSVTSLDDLNEMVNEICKHEIRTDKCKKELGKIYVDTNWACSYVGKPTDRHHIFKVPY